MKNSTLTLLLALGLPACVSPGADSVADEDGDALIVAPQLHVTITGTIRMNGAWFPNSVYEQGELWLVPRSGGSAISLGSTRNRTYSKQVPAGTYDVVYDHIQGNLVPRNEMAVIMSRVALTAPGTLDINVQATAVSGSFTRNGAPAPASIYENARISFHRDGEPEFEVGETRERSYEVVVVPGAYEATYSEMVTNGLMPANVGAVVDERTVMLRSVDWDIDILAVTVSVEPTLDGAGFPASIYENAELSLRDADGGILEVGRTNEGTLSATVLPGVYDVLYHHLIGDWVPQNETTAILSDVAIDFADPFDTEEPFALDVAVTSVELGGDFVLDGGIFPASIYENGRLSLLDSLGREILVSETRHGGYDALRVLPGTYDVLYERMTGGTMVPRNDEHLVSANLIFEASQSHDVSIDTVQAEGTLTVGDGPAPGGAFWARRKVGVYCHRCPWFRLASAGDDAYDAALIPGTYDVVYSLGTDSAAVQADHVLVTGDWLVNADTTRNFVAGDAEIGGLEL